MKNKFKWILNAVTICLCVCAIAISVYAIKYVTLTGTGTIGFKTTGVSATITNVTLSGSTVNHTFESSYVIEADETQEMISSKFADWLALPLEFDANGNDITFSFDIQNTASNDIQYIEMDYSLTFTNSDSSVTKYNAYAIPSENNDYIIAKDEKVNFTLTFKVANNEMSVPDGTKYNLNIFLKDIKPKTLEYDANEDAYYYQDIKYTLDADSETAEVAFYRNEPTNVVIPAVITDGTTDYVVTSIADDGGFFDSPDTYEGCPSLTSLTLPNSITYIGCYSFGADDGIGCPNLTQIYIPISVKSIGECAFANCANLTKVTIASALTDMTSGCIFNSCENLSEVNLPNGMTQLGDYNYDYSTNLTQITLPESLENIDNGVFSGSGLKSITIPSNVTSIENSAFNCTALKTVYIDSAVVASGLEAATSMGCLVQHATNVYVKASLFTNGFTVGAFLYENTTQENITFNGVEYKCFIPKVASDTMGNLLYEYSGSTATVSQVSTTATTGDIVIPSTVTSSDGFEYTVTSVKLRAFYNNTAITSLVIPETVTTIGGSALYGCTNLQSLTTPFIDGYLSKFWGGSSSSSNSTPKSIICSKSWSASSLPDKLLCVG